MCSKLNDKRTKSITHPSYPYNARFEHTNALHLKKNMVLFLNPVPDSRALRKQRWGKSELPLHRKM